MKVLLLLDKSLLGSASHSLCTFSHRNRPTPPPQLWCSADDLTAEVAEKAEAIAVSSHPQPNSAHHLPLPEPSSHQRPSPCCASSSPSPSGAPAVSSPPVHPGRPSSLHQLLAEEESGGRKWGGGEGRTNLQHPPTAVSFWNIAINHNREKTLYFFISEKNSGRNIFLKKQTFLPPQENKWNFHSKQLVSTEPHPQEA